MPDVTGGSTRTRYSDLIKGFDPFETEAYVDYCFESVDVKGSAATDNIGIPLKYSTANSAYYIFTANIDWAANTAKSLGDVVKPTTQNGYEYVCITAGTTNDTEGEPTWPTTEGATVTETDGVAWLCRRAYTGDSGSLSDGSEICILVGAKEGAGFNQADTTLSYTAISMPVIFRGPAGIAEDGITWGSVAAADQAEFLAALKRKGFTVVASGTTVTPTFV